MRSRETSALKMYQLSIHEKVSPKQAFRLATAMRRENTSDSPQGGAGSALFFGVEVAVDGFGGRAVHFVCLKKFFDIGFFDAPDGLEIGEK